MHNPVDATARAANAAAIHLLRQLPVTRRLLRSRKAKRGASPGTVVHTGPRRMEQVRVSLIRFDRDTFEERAPADVPGCFPFAEPPGITWLNVDGLHDVEALGGIAERAGLHPLLVEDVVSVGQRPKVERYPDHLFVVLRSLQWNEERGEVVEEQVSFVLAKHWLITFQEESGDSFDAVRARIRAAGSSVRAQGADYLAYRLMDATIDEYFLVLEKLADRIEGLENRVIDAPTPRTMHEIHHLRRELLVMRKAVWPL